MTILQTVSIETQYWTLNNLPKVILLKRRGKKLLFQQQGRSNFESTKKEGTWKRIDGEEAPNHILQSCLLLFNNWYGIPWHRRRKYQKKEAGCIRIKDFYGGGRRFMGWNVTNKTLLVLKCQKFSLIWTKNKKNKKIYTSTVIGIYLIYMRSKAILPVVLKKYFFHHFY